MDEKRLIEIALEYQNELGEYELVENIEFWNEVVRRYVEPLEKENENLGRFVNDVDIELSRLLDKYKEN